MQYLLCAYSISNHSTDVWNGLMQLSEVLFFQVVTLGVDRYPIVFCRMLGGVLNLLCQAKQ